MTSLAKLNELITVFEIHDATHTPYIKPIIEMQIPDINNNELYVKHLEKIVPKFHSVYSGNSLVKKLFETAGYPVFVPELINREVWQGVSIRQAIKDGDGWEMNVPPSVAKIISEIDLS